MIRRRLFRLLAAAAVAAAVGCAVRGGGAALIVRRQAEAANEAAESLRAAHGPWLTVVPANLAYTWKIVQHQDPDPAHFRAQVIDSPRAAIYYIRVQAPDRVRVESVAGTGLLIAGGKGWTRDRAGQIAPVPVAEYPVLDYAHGIAFYPAARAFLEHTDALDVDAPPPAAAAPPRLAFTMQPTRADPLGCFLWGAGTGLFDTYGGELRSGVHSAVISLDELGRPVAETARAAGHPARARLLFRDYRALPGDRWAPMAAEISTVRAGDDRLTIRLEFQIAGEEVWLLRQAQYLRGDIVLDEVTVTDVALEPIDEKVFAGPEALKSPRPAMP